MCLLPVDVVVRIDTIVVDVNAFPFADMLLIVYESKWYTLY